MRLGKAIDNNKEIIVLDKDTTNKEISTISTIRTISKLIESYINDDTANKDMIPVFIDILEQFVSNLKGEL